jgi:spermidine synthase
LAAALRRLGPTGQVVVAELVPAVVAWNQGPLAALAGHPLRDSRVIVHTGDIAPLLREEARGYDAVLLDVDNGPAGLTRPQNAWLYSRPGLEAAQEALRPAGILAVWSSGPHPVFVRRLHRAGFTVTEVRAPARAARKGRRHTIWLARRAA